VADRGLPSFDLVVATVDRVEELRRLLDSLAQQTHRAFRVLIVDQNEGGPLDGVVHDYAGLDIVRLDAARGLSHARNAALSLLRADLVAFPDDDCMFPPDLLERVATHFEANPDLAGLTGRAATEDGRSPGSWAPDSALLTRENLWNRAISFTIFLRATLVAEIGDFDERLGLGSGGPWTSGEETEYLVRALDRGARIAYEPSIVVFHEEKPLTLQALRSLAAREGASIGYILRKHHYPPRTVARMLVRPVGGALLALARRDRAQAMFHLSTLRGRLLGYRTA
jgi:glycosyltransferase involved in cell wall biosynthesis